MPDSPHIHPLYTKWRDVWRFYELSYLGGKDYIEPDIYPEWTFVSYTGPSENQDLVATDGKLRCFLFPYSREHAVTFEQRRRRSPYRNLCQPALDTVRDLVLAEPVERAATGAPVLEMVWQDVTARGASVDAWMREGLTHAMIQGHAFAVADLGRWEPGAIRTVADERMAGVRPYLTWYTPQMVPNWTLDDSGRIVYLALLEEDRRAPQSPPLWRQIWPDRWELREGPDGTVVDAGINPFGVVPVEVLYARRLPGVRDPMGASFLSTIARLNQEIYNIDSLVGELNYRQGPFLAIPGGEKLTRAQVGLEAAFAVPPDSALPSWVHIPAETYAVLQQQVGDLVLAIKAAAGLSRGVAEQSISARSGEALLVETQDKRAMLSGYRRECEDFERRVWDMVARMLGQAWTGHARYSQKFSTQSQAEAIAEAKEFLSLPTLPDGAKREVIAQLIRERLGHLPAGKVAEIVAEMDRATTAPTIELAPTVTEFVADKQTQAAPPNGANGEVPNAV